MRKPNNKVKNNFRHNIIPFETFEYETLYTFNVNHENDHSMKIIPQALADNDLHDLLKRLSVSWKYRLYREISPAPACKVHYHGYIWALDIDDILFNPKLNVYRELSSICRNASIEIDTIADIKKWHEYCTKQVDQWADLGPDGAPVITNVTEKDFEKLVQKYYDDVDGDVDDDVDDDVDGDVDDNVNQEEEPTSECDSESQGSVDYDEYEQSEDQC